MANKKEDKTIEKEDKINPNHYKGLKNLYVVSPTEVKQAQVIDIIEYYTDDLIGGAATNFGNVLKYLCRFNLKSHDSYQSSQKEKNLEELKKVSWYMSRLNDFCHNKIYRVCSNYIAKPCILSREDKFINGPLNCLDILVVYDAIKDNYPVECREALCEAFAKMQFFLKEGNSGKAEDYLKEIETHLNDVVNIYSSLRD